MATIEERAKEYATDLRGAYREEFFNESTYHGYVKGATEQREIDIKKACEVFEAYSHNVDIRKAFRKAMEG